MNKALVTCIISGDYTLYDLDKKNIITAKPRGVFRNNKTTIKVGDIVTYDKNASVIITKVDKRKNELIRPSIANIDQAIVVTSLKEPDLNLNLLDKFLAILEYNNILPILVFSKIDLLDEDELAKKMCVINYYQKIGYLVFTTTTKESGVIDVIKPYIKDKISVMVGQSGVGKSSLLNIIDENYQLQTDAISKALNRGKHTTRFTILLPFEGGWIADSPGFGIVDLNDFDELILSQSFKEFFKISEKCKYNCCLHINEPGCFVKKSVDDGEILKSRYDNYLLLQKEIRKNRKW